MDRFMKAQKRAKLKRVKQGKYMAEYATYSTEANSTIHFIVSRLLTNADVAKLADALDLGSSSRKGV
jgi:hypothetical protein